MLGLDQKDKALDHLITAFHMPRVSARYEGIANPLAIGIKNCVQLRKCIPGHGKLTKGKGML